VNQKRSSLNRRRDSFPPVLEPNHQRGVTHQFGESVK
jgi:hypothetical protein